MCDGRNDRNVRNTPFQFLPSRVEQASIETYAVSHARGLNPNPPTLTQNLKP